jgi:hypothetical protein
MMILSITCITVYLPGSYLDQLMKFNIVKKHGDIYQNHQVFK